MTGVVDYSLARPGGALLRRLGFDGVMRYIGPYRYDGAIITRDEYRDLVDNGLAVGLVMEYSAQYLMNGYTWCKQVADGSRQQEASMGIPVGLTYGASDWDVTLGGPPQSPQALDNCRRSLDGLHGIADGLGGWQYVRPYGSKSFCEWACANSPMTGSWSTQAWSNYVPATNADLYQYAGWPAGVPFAAGCDYNEVRGDWAPRNGHVPPPIPSPTPGDLMLATVDLNRPQSFASPATRTIRGLLCAWERSVDGILITPDDTNSDRTRRGVADFQKAVGLKPDRVVGPQTWKALLLAVEAH